MNKDALLQELRDHTLVMLKPSTIQGVGVFAITKIKKGHNNIFSNDKSEWLPVPKEEIEALPAHSRAVVENYCLYDERNYYVPEYGFKILDLVVFLNHSDVPNIASVNDGEYFIALRDIENGEELTLDYGEIV